MEMDDPGVQRLTLCVQMRSLMKGVKDVHNWVLENRFYRGKDYRGRPDIQTHINEKLHMTKTLGNDIVELMKMSKLDPTKREWEVILATAKFLGRTFSLETTREGWTLIDVGFDTFIQFFVDSLYNDFVDCDILIVRYEFLLQLMLHLDCEKAFHFLFEALVVKIKSALVRIHKLGLNTNNSGLVNMIDVDILFKYFDLVEKLLPRMSLTKEELFKLQSIERTTAEGLPHHTLILFAAARVALLGTARVNTAPTPIASGNSKPNKTFAAM